MWSSSQPNPFINFWEVLRTTVRDQISTVRKTNKYRTWQGKFTDENACLYSLHKEEDQI